MKKTPCNGNFCTKWQLTREEYQERYYVDLAVFPISQYYIALNVRMINK
jgi:hypothetical protein